MLTLITIVALYALGMGFFWLLGGLGSAAEALRSWGEAASAAARPLGSSS